MKKKVWIGIGLVVAAIGWYAFRPELLFVNKSVSESFPAANRCCQHSRLRGEAKAVGDGTVHDRMARVLRYGRENISLE